MPVKRLSRRTIVYAILLVAVFLLLALVVSGCAGGLFFSGSTIVVSKADLENPKPHVITHHANIGDPFTCNNIGRPPNITVVRQAAHGRVLIKPGAMEVCENGHPRSAPTTDVLYLPNKGFLGTDSYSIIKSELVGKHRPQNQNVRILLSR